MLLPPKITARWLKSVLDAKEVSRPEEEIALWVRIVLAAGAQRLHELNTLSERAWSRIDLPVIVEDAVRSWLEGEYSNGKGAEEARSKAVVKGGERAFDGVEGLKGDEPIPEVEGEDEDEIDPYLDVELAKLVALDDVEDGRWRAAGGDPERCGANATLFKRLKTNPTVRQVLASAIFILACVSVKFLYRFSMMIIGRDGDGGYNDVLHAHASSDGKLESAAEAMLIESNLYDLNDNHVIRLIKVVAGHPLGPFLLVCIPLYVVTFILSFINLPLLPWIVSFPDHNMFPKIGVTTQFLGFLGLIMATIFIFFPIGSTLKL